MKRKLTLSFALVLSITILLLTSSDSRVEAQNQIRIVADTGVMKPGPNQALRLTVNAGAGSDTVTVRFRRQQYIQTACSGGVCKYSVSSQTTSDPITLSPGEATAWYELDLTGFYRAMVLSNSRDVIVNAQIVNTSTGEITSSIVFDTSTQR
jgi:hypothetical protein